jgi:serine/threonine protein kinase
MRGSVFNQYRIEELLGEGATGVVFRAHDLRLHRQVARKLLIRDPQTDQVAWGRMLREARAISCLDHPGFCAIYEAAKDQGRAYMAMEYIAGRSLRRLLPGKGLEKERILHYGSQIAAALAYAHGRGIIHRDVKSSNVIVKPNEAAKLVDLGLPYAAAKGVGEICFLGTLGGGRTSRGHAALFGPRDSAGGAGQRSK